MPESLNADQQPTQGGYPLVFNVTFPMTTVYENPSRQPLSNARDGSLQCMTNGEMKRTIPKNVQSCCNKGVHPQLSDFGKTVQGN